MKHHTSWPQFSALIYMGDSGYSPYTFLADIYFNLLFLDNNLYSPILTPTFVCVIGCYR
jgi:hypothetical protein